MNGDGVVKKGDSDKRMDMTYHRVNNVRISGVSTVQLHQLSELLDQAKTKYRLCEENDNSRWIIDTGASNHVTGDFSVLRKVRNMKKCPVGLPDGNTILADQEGSVELDGGLKLEHVLYVPKLTCNLISVSQLVDEANCVLQFTNKFCVIQDLLTRNVIGAGEKKDGLYFFRGVPRVKALSVNRVSKFDLWHQRMGHPSEKVLKLLPFVSHSCRSENNICDVCPRAKQPRSSFPISVNKASRIFELVHIDLWGPYKTSTSCGATYFLTIVDDFSRAVWIYLLCNKMEVESMFFDFVTMVERQFEQVIKRVRSDNGTEFFCLRPYFRRSGIIFETSCVGTPQQNGRVERKHRHILNVARALMFQGHMPMEFWGECVLTACHLINRTPSYLLSGKSPCEILYEKRPSYDALRVFGCLCYAHDLRHKGDKFASRSRRCVFVGYPFGKKGWKLYDLDTCEYFVSRDVVFFEKEFPYAKKNKCDGVESTPIQRVDDAWSDDEDGTNSSHYREPHTTQPESFTPKNGGGSGVASEEQHTVLPEGPNRSAAVNEEQRMVLPLRGGAHGSGVVSLEQQTVLPVTGRETGSGTVNEEQRPVQLNAEGGCRSGVTNVEQRAVLPSTNGVENIASDSEVRVVDETLGRGKRVKTPSTKYRDYITHTVRKISPSNNSSGVSPSSGTPYPITHYVNCDRFSIAHRQFLAAITAGREPKNFKEAMKEEGWRDAMRKEIKALEDNGTWVMEPLPPGKKALGSQWIYKIKYRSDGSRERLKARLVVYGNHQVEGIDYNETFAPVAKMVTVRTFLAIAAVKKWDVHQMDVHNAFLHGDLGEEVYMRLPPGFKNASPNTVCRLKKSLYGLKQAPRCWFAKLSSALKNYGFQQSYSDYSLFTLRAGQIQLNVLVYVDDLIVAGNDRIEVNKFKCYLGKCFHMKDLGVLKYFLGIEVARSATGIFLCQRKYALEIISETGLLGAKPAAFPMEQNHSLALNKSDLLKDPAPYRRLIGRLIYLSVTRPDLAYSVHILSQFMQEPRVDHWEAALRVVRYLKKNPGQGILLRSDGNLMLEGWCDSDWASCPVSRRSLTGWFVLLGQSPISWKTKKQHTVARSSAEAEYRSMAGAVCELKWLKQLLGDLGVKHSAGMNLYCDSQSALHIAQNPVFHERTKHIEVDCHFVRDAITEGLVCPSHVSTHVQLADIFTKALGKAKFEFLLRKLGVHNLHAPT